MARRDSEKGYDGVEEEVQDRREVTHDVEEEAAEEECYRRSKRQRAGKRPAVVGGGGGAEGEIEEEDDDEEGEDLVGGSGGSGGRGRQRKKRPVFKFIDFEAEVDDDEEEEDEEEGEEDDFIDEAADLGNEPELRMGRVDFIAECEEDIDEMERRVMERYTRPSHLDYAGDANEVEQQALLPTLSDPKLWLVKCAIGHEREIAIRLMQRSVHGKVLCISSVIALDHLKNYIYVEAETVADVKEALDGLRNVFSSFDPQVVPIEEMTSVLSVENKIVEITKGAWVRMRRGDYKGDLAQVVDVDDVKREVTVKLIPRLDLQYLAEKSAAKARDKLLKKKTVVPPPRFFNKEEVRKYKNLKVCKKRDRNLGEGFVQLEAPSLPLLMFKDGFLYKTVSMKSISTNYVQPSFAELEMFKGRRRDACGDIPNLSTMFASRKKGHFMKGDAVIVVRGDLKNLEGWVQKVEGDTVHIRPKITRLPETLSFNSKELCKFFKPGERIKVVSGVLEGASGTVVKVNGHVLTVLSDTTREHIHVFADYAVKNVEFTKPLAQMGGYELYDLVQLIDKSFGVIIRLEIEGLEVFQGVPDRPKVRAVNLREIKNKIYWGKNAKDRSNNIISAKDVVRIIEGPLKGKQGLVKHLFNGMLFIHDPCRTEHAGFICTKAQSCLLVGGSNNGNFGDVLGSRPGAPSRPPGSQFRGPPHGVASSQFSSWSFGGRGQGHGKVLVGKYVKVKSGPYKGYRGRVVGFKGVIVRVELESLMKTINFSRDQIIGESGTPAPALSEARSLPGARTPRTALHPVQTPMRDVGAIPMPGGMRSTSGSDGASYRR